MKNTISLSVITLTKNRAQLLEKCLASLKRQLRKSDEIILIDNNSTDNTQAVVKKYQHILSVRPYKTGLVGYPSLYNFAIAKGKKDVLIFLDDDCIATEDLLSRIRERFREKRNFVLQGKTRSLPRGNIFAEISEDHLTNWIQSNVVEKNRLRVIDNRNFAIPKAIIQRVGGFSPNMEAGSEDVELGMRLFRLGIPIIYDTSIIAYHHERTTLKGFLSQHYRIAQSHAVLDSKFSEEQNISIINRRTLTRHLLSALKRQYMYWYERRYRDAFFLSLIYILLAITRVVGYLSGRHE